MPVSDKLRNCLIYLASHIPPASFFPSKSAEASELIVSDPYAFLIACCLDRGTKAEIIWSIPYDFKSTLGHLNPSKIGTMKIYELEFLLKSINNRPRYMKDAPKTIHDLTAIILEESNGDAANIWQGKLASEVKRTLMSIHGVGSGIASMTVLLIDKAFTYRFKDLERKNMDIKPDVHTRRVLYRLGISSSDSEIAAIEAARILNPVFPGELDGPLWWIGRNWCHARNPECSACPINADCEKKDLDEK